VNATDGSENTSDRSTRAVFFKKRRHRRMSDFDRIVRLRRKMGIDEALFAPVPLFKPWCRAKWYLQRAELQHREALLYNDLSALLEEAERFALIIGTNQ
jgi:hypothetical protein